MMSDSVSPMETPLAPDEQHEPLNNGVHIEIKRTFQATAQEVFDAWTTPEALKQWWGPKGFQLDVISLDVVKGGIFHYCMRAGDENGLHMFGKFVFREVEVPNKLVFVNAFSNEQAETIRAPFSETWPLEVHNTLTLYDQDGGTTLTVIGAPLNPTPEELITFATGIPLIQQGFNGTFDQLDRYLQSKRNDEN